MTTPENFVSRWARLKRSPAPNVELSQQGTRQRSVRPPRSMRRQQPHRQRNDEAIEPPFDIAEPALD